MAHKTPGLQPDDFKPLGTLGTKIFRGGVVVGIAGLILALLVAVIMPEGMRRFWFAYLFALAYFLSITLGSLFFVIITHLFKAGWCSMVRRIPETIAANMPVVALLAVPVVAVAWLNNGMLYPWAVPAGAYPSHAYVADDHAHDGHDHGAEQARETAEAPTQVAGDHAQAHDEHHAELPVYTDLAGYMIKKKASWLNPGFFTLRVAICFGLWILIGLWFWKTSLKQDANGDKWLSLKRENYAAPATIAFALTITMIAFDLLMSLDPAWFSTMYGVYFFAGSFMSCGASMVLILRLLQKKGYAPSVSVEQYHDLARLMFGFVFFWGYVAYSQFMLIWYASLPETTYWFELRGVSTASTPSAMAIPTGWSILAVVLLVGHLLLPFAVLLSRHVKRCLPALTVVAVWLLLMQAADLFWLIRPVLSTEGIVVSGEISAGVGFEPLELLIIIGCFLGVGGLTVAGVAKRAEKHAVVAVGDPRAPEAIAFEGLY